MIIPTTSDVLRNLEHHFEQQIKPVLVGTPQQTIAQTMAHLLRHARVRVEREGQLLTDEAARLRSLLPDVAKYLGRVGDTALPAAVGEVVRRRFREAGRYPDLDSLAGEVAALREVLYNGLRALQAMRSERGGEADYQALRQAIRDYMTWQVSAEAELVELSFVGQGPRR